jgi:hypothetical protein
MNRVLAEVAGTAAEEFKEKDFRCTMSLQSTTRKRRRMFSNSFAVS